LFLSAMDLNPVSSSCLKIVILTILGGRFARKPRMILQTRGLQKRALRKMAVHPCTARQCPSQNRVLGQELTKKRHRVR
jgi:hypothetical protein